MTGRSRRRASTDPDAPEARDAADGQGRARKALLSVWTIVVAGFVVRLGTMVALHMSEAYFITSRGAVAPDVATTDRAARILLEHGDHDVEKLIGSVHTAWVRIATFLYEHVWNSLTALKLFNVVVGTLVVLLAYRLGRRVGGTWTARFAGWTTALFPTLVVWSALALRETLVVALVLLIVLSAHALVTDESRRALARANLPWIVLLSAALVVLALTRTYMALVLAGPVGVAGLSVAIRRRSAAPVAGVLVATAVAVAGLAALPDGRAVMASAASLIAEPSATPLNPLAEDPDSPDDPGGDERFLDSVQSIEEKGVVRGSAIAVLAGRPVWRTVEYYFLVQPGVVAWWVLLPSFALGAVVLSRRGVATWMLTAGTVCVIIAMLAVTGLFIRHHAMLEPLAIVTAAYGWDRWADVPLAGRRLTTVGTVCMFLAAVVSVAASLV